MPGRQRAIATTGTPIASDGANYPYGNSNSAITQPIGDANGFPEVVLLDFDRRRRWWFILFGFVAAVVGDGVLCN